MSGTGFTQIRYEGLREVARALKVIDADLLSELRKDMREVGAVIRDDAKMRMREVGQRYGKNLDKTAAGFRVQTNLLSSSAALVSVSQRRLKTTGMRPDYGALQVTHAMLPARDAKYEEAVAILYDGAYKLMKENGF